VGRPALALVLALALFLLVGPRAAHAAEPTPLLPNIVADAPSNVSMETSTTEGGLKASGEAKLLLRFNGYIHNVGPGALDFRGYRKSSSEPMKAFQRVYNKDGTYKEEPSKAELVYATADGHEHWHLQRAAKYSLWNSAKTAEAAPAMKVGFCLDDSEHVESGIGPSTAVYSDANGREFCRRRQPQALNLFEGVSVGWRDLYSSGLAFQWVDASNVLPGEYWLREDVNPTGVIKETGGANTPTYAKSPTIIPGFDALAQSASTAVDQPKPLTLTSKAWKDSATPKYTIVSAPQHGQLGAVNKNQVTYTPAAGYSGVDSFTFSASDPNSPFPRHPAVATVSIEVTGPAQPAVTIEGAPASMTAGTSVQLSAHVINDSPTVTWAASAGSITTGGLYTAPSEPPAGGSVVVTATTAKGAHDQRTIEIVSVNSKVLLAGDATTTYSVGDQTTAGREEAFQFTAKSTGTVEEMQFRTNATANTGVTGISVGIFADNAGKPGAVLGKATVSGQPATSSWIKAAGLSTAVVSGTKYWLVVLPLGPSTSRLHYNVAKTAKAGTGNVESTTGGLGSLTAEASWETFNQGPVGFQALGATTSAASVPAAARALPTATATRLAGTAASGPTGLARASAMPQPSVGIEGAPASMTAGTSVQLSAHVAHDASGVTWSASAGSITASGLYTAPSVPPPGGSVIVRAGSATGASDRRVIAIVPVPSPQAAPAAPLPEAGQPATAAGGQGSGPGTSPSSGQALPAPRAMLFGHKLIITTTVGGAGRISLGAYLGNRSLGSCAVQTPANRNFTCRLDLAGVPPDAPIALWADLRAGARTVRSARAAEPIPPMPMPVASPQLRIGSPGLAAQLICGPSMRLAGLTLRTIAKRFQNVA